MSEPTAVSQYPSFEESISSIEESLRARLKAKKPGILPSFKKPVILKEWDHLDDLRERLNSISPTDPAFELLGQLSAGEEYFVLKHETYWAYFVHDLESNQLVGLLVRRRDEGEDVLVELEPLLKRFRDRDSK